MGTSGVAWDGAAFCEAGRDAGGLVPDAIARKRLDSLVVRLNEDRLVRNEGHVFNRSGSRLAV